MLTECLEFTLGAVSSSGAAGVKNLWTSLIVKWNCERYSQADVDTPAPRTTVLI